MPIGRRSAAVLTGAMGTLTVEIDNTARNLALPSIRDDPSLDLVGMQWIAAAYVLVLAAATMLAGALGDRFGQRRIPACGLLISTIGSLLGTLAWEGGALAASRVRAAIGASVIAPVGLATLRLIAETARQPAAYTSLWGLCVGLGMALGPVIGGVVTGLLGWRACFGIMGGLGIAYTAAVMTFLPRFGPDGRRRLDPVSHATPAVGTVCLTAFFIELGSDAPREAPACSPPRRPSGGALETGAPKPRSSRPRRSGIARIPSR